MDLVPSHSGERIVAKVSSFECVQLFAAFCCLFLKGPFSQLFISCPSFLNIPKQGLSKFSERKNEPKEEAKSTVLSLPAPIEKITIVAEQQLSEAEMPKATAPPGVPSAAQSKLKALLNEKEEELLIKDGKF